MSKLWVAQRERWLLPGVCVALRVVVVLIIFRLDLMVSSCVLVSWCLAVVPNSPIPQYLWVAQQERWLLPGVRVALRVVVALHAC